MCVQSMVYSILVIISFTNLLIISASFPLQPNTKLDSVGAVHEFFNSINLIFNRITKNVARQLQ